MYHGGGLIRLALDKMKKEDDEKKRIVNDGVLFCSGMIAGEGLVGILLALLAVFGVSEALDVSTKLNLPTIVADVGSIVVFILIILSALKFSLFRKTKKSK